jgi:hypothetical protein
LSGSQVGCSDCSLSNEVTFSVAIINGVQLNKRFAIGLGTGIDTYKQWKTMPIFIQASEKLWGKKNGLHAQFNIGYAYGWMDKLGYTLPNFTEQGGLVVQPALLYQFNSGKFDICFSVGYKYQKVSYSYRNDWSDPTNSTQYYNEARLETVFNRVVFQIGFGWK